MCRGSEYVAADAEPVLAALLRDLSVALAVEAGVDPAVVVIGPVDFGSGERG